MTPEDRQVIYDLAIIPGRDRKGSPEGVLRHFWTTDGEMDLAVVIDSHHPDDRLGLAVPGHHHDPGTDAGGVTSLAQRGPAESLIVLVVEVGYQVDAVRPRCKRLWGERFSGVRSPQTLI